MFSTYAVSGEYWASLGRTVSQTLKCWLRQEYQACLLCSQKRRLRWLGHVSRMQDGRIPKHILFGELTTGSRSTGRPLLRFKDVCKRDLKAGNISPGNLEALVEDRATWRHAIDEASRTREKRREDKVEESKARKRQKTGSVPTDPTNMFMCTTCSRVCRSKLDCTAIAGDAPQTN